MGSEVSARSHWEMHEQMMRAIAEKLDSPHADKIFIAKDYTKADLRNELLATIPPVVQPKS